MALKRKKRIWLSLLLALLLLSGISFGWLSLYYPADETAAAALLIVFFILMGFMGFMGLMGFVGLMGFMGLMGVLEAHRIT